MRDRAFMVLEASPQLGTEALAEAIGVFASWCELNDARLVRAYLVSPDHQWALALEERFNPAEFQTAGVDVFVSDAPLGQVAQRLFTRFAGDPAVLVFGFFAAEEDDEELAKAVEELKEHGKETVLLYPGSPQSALEAFPKALRAADRFLPVTPGNL